MGSIWPYFVYLSEVHKNRSKKRPKQIRTGCTSWSYIDVKLLRNTNTNLLTSINTNERFIEVRKNHHARSQIRPARPGHGPEAWSYGIWQAMIRKWTALASFYWPSRVPDGIIYVGTYFLRFRVFRILQICKIKIVMARCTAVPIKQAENDKQRWLAIDWQFCPAFGIMLTN